MDRKHTPTVDEVLAIIAGNFANDPQARLDQKSGESRYLGQSADKSLVKRIADGGSYTRNEPPSMARGSKGGSLVAGMKALAEGTDSPACRRWSRSRSSSNPSYTPGRPLTPKVPRARPAVPASTVS
jgi:hypothetical protein